MGRIKDESAPEKSLEDIHNEAIARIKPILGDIWLVEAPIQDFDVVFNPSGIVFNVRYESIHELDKITQDVIAR